MRKIYILTKIYDKNKSKVIAVRCSIPIELVENWDSIVFNKIDDNKIEIIRGQV